MTDLAVLERRALELMKRGDFGDEAVGVNAAILEQTPDNVSAWTRLGRCHLEQRNFDEAVTALRAALAINPAHGVAANLLNEVRKRRALTPTAKERATTGFTAREFAILETGSAEEIARSLQPRIELLFDAVNASSIGARAAEARRRHAGETGTKLFHANSVHVAGPGHLTAFQHGGRWEPQLNVGWQSSPPFPSNSVRIGLGFQIAQERAGADGAAHLERAARRLRAISADAREVVEERAGAGGWVRTADSSSTANNRRRRTSRLSAQWNGCSRAAMSRRLAGCSSAAGSFSIASTMRGSWPTARSSRARSTRRSARSIRYGLAASGLDSTVTLSRRRASMTCALAIAER